MFTAESTCELTFLLSLPPPLPCPLSLSLLVAVIVGEKRLGVQRTSLGSFLADLRRMQGLASLILPAVLLPISQAGRQALILGESMPFERVRKKETRREPCLLGKRSIGKTICSFWLGGGEEVCGLCRSWFSAFSWQHPGGLDFPEEWLVTPHPKQAACPPGAWDKGHLSQEPHACCGKWTPGQKGLKRIWSPTPYQNMQKLQHWEVKMIFSRSHS